MFNHIMVGATDIEASKKFYDATLGVLGMQSLDTSISDTVVSLGTCIS